MAKNAQSGLRVSISYLRISSISAALYKSGPAKTQSTTHPDLLTEGKPRSVMTLNYGIIIKTLQCAPNLLEDDDLEVANISFGIDVDESMVTARKMRKRYVRTDQNRRMS